MTKYLFSNSTGFNNKGKRMRFLSAYQDKKLHFPFTFFYILTQNHATRSLASLTFTEAIHNKAYIFNINR